MIEINWSTIPTKTGVYLWKADNGQVIYVGKAKNLRNRMKQYFKDDLSPKNKLLLKNIVDFDYQVCVSEVDALILEQNLINEYEPKFNIKIKSAKKYPYIELSFKNNIKLTISKQLKFKKSLKYYGPYPDGYSARRIINILSSALPLESCLAPNSGKQCLNFEMGRCVGNCIGLNTEQKKQFVLNSIEEFFKGKTEYVEQKIKERIQKNNELLNFEESQKLLNNIEFIEKFKEQKILKFKDMKHRDIFNFFVKDGIISISVMFIRFGMVNLTANFMNKQFNPNIIDLFESFINKYYEKNLVPDEVIIPFELEWQNEKIKYVVPQKGVRKELLDLTQEHAKSKHFTNVLTFLDKIKNYDETIDFFKQNSNFKQNKIFSIEMIDISSTMGFEQVGAIIQFKNGEPYPLNYRKYIVNSVNNMDDYASMAEITKRHFKRKLLEHKKLPEVFLVDGKQQLRIVQNVAKELNLENKVLFFALKKDEKHNTDSIIRFDFKEIKLNRESNMYKFLNLMQDEVHRFVINFHRKRRKKAILESELDKYSFLTEIDKQNLFKEFKSIRKILIASESELKRVLSSTKVKKFIELRNLLD